MKTRALTADERRRLIDAPITIRVHGRSTSMAGASIRRRGARPQSAAARYLKHNRPRAAAKEE